MERRLGEEEVAATLEAGEAAGSMNDAKTNGIHINIFNYHSLARFLYFANVYIFVTKVLIILHYFWYIPYAF